MIESPFAVVKVLLIISAVLIMGCCIWRFVVEPRRKARDPRHMIEAAAKPKAASQDVHRPAWQSIPIAQLEPDNGEPAPVSQATKVVHPAYILADALRRRG